MNPTRIYLSLAKLLEIVEFPRGDKLKEVWHNCSAHRSAHLLIIEISSHSHVKRKQPRKILLQYSCSVTMIKIVKKCLWGKIHELNTLVGSPMILSHKHRISMLQKVACCRITTSGSFRSFVKFCMQSFRFFRN